MNKSLGEIKVTDDWGFVGGLGSMDGWEEHGPESTEWEDALVKHKIISKRIKVKTVDQLNKEWREEQEALKATEMDRKTLEEINEMEDEIDDVTLLEYRRERIKKLQEQASKEKYGTIREITKPEFIAEVSEGSIGQWVVCCLYALGNRDNTFMLQCLRNIAARHKDVKFCQIVGSQCIENYPDRNCPTLLVYNDNKVLGHIKGAHQFGGKKMNADIIEWELAKIGMFKSDQEENPWMKFAKLHYHGKKAYTDEAGEDEDSDSLDL